MEQIEQLKAIRDAAVDRMEEAKKAIDNGPDGKLSRSLTVLIDELEESFGSSGSAGTTSEEEGEDGDSAEEDSEIAATASEEEGKDGDNAEDDNAIAAVASAADDDVTDDDADEAADTESEGDDLPNAEDARRAVEGTRVAAPDPVEEMIAEADISAEDILAETGDADDEQAAKLNGTADGSDVEGDREEEYEEAVAEFLNVEEYTKQTQTSNADEREEKSFGIEGFGASRRH